MFLKKTFLATAVAVAALAAIPTTHAATATGQTIFTVQLQPIVVLDYYSEIDLNINSTALQTLAGTPAGQAVTAIAASAPGGAVLTANAAITPSAVNLSAVQLTISNAWAVRSISTPGTGSTTVTIGLNGATGPSATLTGVTDTASTIGLSNPGTSFAGLTGGTGFTTPVNGDVKMTMDLSTAQSAQNYTGATIYITATST